MEPKADSLEDVDVEVFAEAAGVVVEDGLGISKTFHNGKHFHGLEWPKRVMAETGAFQHVSTVTESVPFCEYLSQVVISAFV